MQDETKSDPRDVQNAMGISFIIKSLSSQKNNMKLEERSVKVWREKERKGNNTY
jgi:hypothetical protein